MNRETLRQKMKPLSEKERAWKKYLEKTGEFAVNPQGPHVRQGGRYGLLSNESQSIAPEQRLDDSLHAPLFNRESGSRLRLIIHQRFQRIPPHTTEFISINYVYQGNLELDFPDHRHLNLHKGQLIFMNSDIVHQMTIRGENDLILGIQIEKEYVSERFLSGFRGEGPVTDFLAQTLSGKTSDFTFLIAGFEEDIRMQNLFEDLFCEYLDPGALSQELAENHMRIFFTFLVRSTSGSVIKSSSRADMLAILSFIEEHCEHCSLSDLSREFHFHPKYLGNLIRSGTGRTFQSILEEFRLRKAAHLFEVTDLTVRDVAEQCGYSNITFFYRHFEARYGMLPAEYRRERRMVIPQPSETSESFTDSQKDAGYDR